MSWIRCTGLGLIAALYVLSGRWDLSRLSPSPGSEPNPLLEVRLWTVLGAMVLGAMGLVHYAHREATPGETRPDFRLSAALLLFCGYMCLSALWAPPADVVLPKIYDVILLSVMTVSYGLAVLRQPAERVLDAFWSVVVLASGVLALAALRQVLSGGATGERLAVLGGGPNIFVRLMGMLSLGALYFWHRRGQTWLWIPMAATGVLLALLTGSRGGTLAITGSIAVFLVVGRVPLRRLALLSLLATVAVTGVTMFTPMGKALSYSMEQRFLRLTLEYEPRGDEQNAVYLSGRESLYAAAYQLGLDNPVTGAGLAGFPALGLGVYPHNVFLEVFCEGGGVGLVFLGWVLLAFVHSSLRARRGLDAATTGAVVLMLIGNQSSGDLYDCRGMFLLMMMSACTASAAQRPAPAALPDPPASSPAVQGAS